MNSKNFWVILIFAIIFVIVFGAFFPLFIESCEYVAQQTHILP